MSDTPLIYMHRKIRAVVRASDSKEAIKMSVTGLENAMDDDVLANGTVATLAGDHTLFSPSTYFATSRDKTGHRISSQQGKNDLAEAIQFTEQKPNCYLYEIERRDAPFANPIPDKHVATQMKQQLETKTDAYWIVTFDLRYDYDANPHKPYEILD